VTERQPAPDWSAVRRKRKRVKSASELMPPSMRRIAAIIGEEKTFELISKLGGTMVYVAGKAQPETLLVDAIGAAAARKLAKEFGGTHLDLPVATRAVTLWLKSRGHSNNEIARIQRISAHTVARRLAGLRDDAQLDLFSSPQ
jgi:DNA-directed RNA polymerase specialized sigma24 family protein